MMTKKYVAFCGYRCDLCPAYVKNVDKLSNRTVIKNGWKFFFGFDVPEERIMCVGCNDEGNHLDADCPVRPCALRADVQNCSFSVFLNPVIHYDRELIYLMNRKRNLLIRFRRRSTNYFFVRMKEEKS
jgi:Golgi nucleoside diphosphatase